MAGFVILVDGSDIEWHVGEKLPPLKDKPAISRVQLDGDELSYVLQRCENLPVARLKRVVTYPGDFAKFIVENVLT